MLISLSLIACGDSGKIYSVDEFKKIVVELDGKSPEEVAKVIGLPKSRVTGALDGTVEVWAIEGIKDPLTGKTNGISTVMFKSGKFDGKQIPSFAFP